MIDNLHALISLSETGTITKAASKLHLTQSAVTRRIQSLEDQVGCELIERAGRNVILTHQGRRLLTKARPLVSELRDILAEEVSEAQGTVVMAVSESMLYSWGADVLAKVQKKLPNIELIINSHSCRVAKDKVRSGENMLAISPGGALEVPDLAAKHLFMEPMVIVPSGLKKFSLPKKGKVEVISAEKGESTWVALQSSLKLLYQKRQIKISNVKSIRTFSGVLKMAEAGFGHGLLPIGVARAFKVPESKIIHLPKPGLFRPVSLVGRPTTLNRRIVQALSKAMIDELKLLGLCE